VCTSPTRFLVQERIHDRFVDAFLSATHSLVVGDGMDPRTDMGPLVRERRVAAMEGLVADAVAAGASIARGGKRVGDQGYFFDLTVLTDVPRHAQIMNTEPFGPVVPVTKFRTVDDAISEANRLPYGLAAYAYTGSAKTMSLLGMELQAGVISINHNGVALPETPFGGLKDSGYGSEGGAEVLDPYLNTRFITQRAI
jgi:succinate-semialdehyde dehydrogenase/glutarate-semialdehyde dehydrogenase